MLPFSKENWEFFFFFEESGEESGEEFGGHEGSGRVLVFLRGNVFHKDVLIEFKIR